jgi:hypothetical protein
VSIEEIIHTCSNEKVAQAAVASLGFDFARRVRIEAENHGATTGAFVAKLVREFGKSVDPDECLALDRMIKKADQPILCGLRLILEARLKSIEGVPHRQWPLGSLPGTFGPNLEIGQLG